MTCGRRPASLRSMSAQPLITAVQAPAHVIRLRAGVPPW
jgi:hypothetical protein